MITIMIRKDTFADSLFVREKLHKNGWTDFDEVFTEIVLFLFQQKQNGKR